MNTFPYILFMCVILVSGVAQAQSYDDLARQQLEWQQKRMQVDQFNANQIPTYQVPAPAPAPAYPQQLPNNYGYQMPSGAAESGLYGLAPAYDPNAAPAPAQVKGEGKCRHSQTGPSMGCYNYARGVAEQECGPAPSPFKVSYEQLQAHSDCTTRVYKRVVGVIQ